MASNVDPSNPIDMYLVHRIATDLYSLKQYYVNSRNILSPNRLYDPKSFLAERSV